MATQKNSDVAACPECGGQVRLKGVPKLGQKLSCRDCGEELVVISRKPVEFDLAGEGYMAFDDHRSEKKDSGRRGGDRSRQKGDDLSWADQDPWYFDDGDNKNYRRQ